MNQLLELNEEWRLTNKSNGNVFVSNLGRVKFLKNGKKKITIGGKDAYGYLRVFINKKTYKVHRLVCECFLSDFDTNMTVNHKDFNKENNNILNLELMSFAENRRDYINKKGKEKSSSKVLGVGFHKGINKWTARVNYEGNRVSIGVFEKEQDAILAIKNFSPNNIKKGKGQYKKSAAWNEIKNRQGKTVDGVFVKN